MKKAKKHLPTSPFGRARKLFSMGSAVIGKELKSRLTETLAKHGGERALTRLKQAEDLVETLGQLKGAAMKAGQLLSLEISDLLPPEVADILRTLHDKAPAADIELIQSVLDKELGAKAAALEDLTPEPVAAASIGQVHAAVVDGQKVAVKVQYPGVAASIDSDLKLLQKFASTVITLYGKSMDVGPLFSEIRESLHREVDYVAEADALETYKNLFEDTQYRIPNVLRDYSSKRVLTMSYEEGQRINDWLKKDLSQEQRDQFGHIILNLLYSEFFRFGMVQTDPNYGNFLYRPEDPSLVLLDFGATKSYSKEFRQDIRQLLKLAYDRKHMEVIDFCIDRDILDAREDQEVKDLFFHLMTDIVFMFRPENQPFAYDDSDYLQRIRERSTAIARQAKYSPPAKNLIFLNRKLGGMYHLLKEAKCKIDLQEYWQKVQTGEDI